MAGDFALTLMPCGAQWVTKIHVELKTEMKKKAGEEAQHTHIHSSVYCI